MILLDYRDRRPIYEQIVERFAELMETGALPQDSQMPSVRSMAMELSINPNTIQRAYMELERRGYIYSVKGKGSFVADNRQIMKHRGENLLAELRELTERALCLGLRREQLLEVIGTVYGAASGDVRGSTDQQSAAVEENRYDTAGQKIDASDRGEGETL